MRRSMTMPSIRIAATWIILLALAACKTGPDYTRPELAMPDRYKSANAQEATEPALALDWWRLFEDEELNTLEEEALRSSHTLQAAMARVAQARASADATRSGFYPVVTMDPSASRTRRPVTTTQATTTATRLNEAASLVSQTSGLVSQLGGLKQAIQGTTADDTTTTGTTGATGTLGSGSMLSALGTLAGTETITTGSYGNSFQVPFDLSYEIDIWGRVRRSCESARAQIQVSTYDLEVVRQTLLADVAQNYFQLRSLDAQAEILANNIRLYEEQADLTEMKCKAGLVSETNVLQARVQLESTRVQEQDIRRQRADVEHAIAILLGKAPVDFSIEARPLTGTPPVIPAGLPADLLRRRPDVAEAEQQLASACAEIGVAKAEFLPAVKLTGSAGFESADIKDALNWENRFWSVGPSISLPIFEGGKLKANLRQAKARYDELEATYRQTVLTAFGDVEDSLTDLHLRADAAEAQTKAVDAAREYFRLTQIEFQTGVVDYLQVTDAEQSLLTNELSAVQLLSERMISSVLLMKALGGGWDTDAPAPEIPEPQGPAPAAPAPAAPAAPASSSGANQ